MKEKLMAFGGALLRYILIDHFMLTLLVTAALLQDWVMVVAAAFCALYFKLHDIYEAIKLKAIEIHPVLNIKLDKEVTQ